MTPLLAFAPAAVVFAAGLAIVRAPLVDKAAVCGLVLCAVALAVVVP